MYTYSYLKKRDIKIFKDGQQILVGPSKNYPAQEAKIEKGTSLVFKKGTLTEPYDFLVQHNVIIAERMEDVGATQKKFYFLAYINSNTSVVKKLPAGITIEYSPEERVVRIRGKNCHDNWFPIDRPIPKEYEKETRSRDITYEDTLKNDPFYVPKVDYIEITWMCTGVTFEGELACIEKPDSDANCYSIIGQRGMGKSTLGHLLKDDTIEYNYGLVIETNDRKNETVTYTETWSKGEFLSDYLQMINKFSKPMPMIYFYPNNDILERQKKEGNNIVFKEGELGFVVSIPFLEVLKDRQIMKYYDLWDMGRSLKYFRKLLEVPDFIELNTYKEREEYISGLVKKKEIQKGTGDKLITILFDIESTKVFDITNKIPTKWEIEIDGVKYSKYPWICALMAKLSVSICTPHIINEPYYPIVYRFILNSIFQEMKINPLMAKCHLYFFAEEVHDLLKEKNAKRIVDESIKTGRSDGVGTGITTQHYADIFPSLRTNINYTFVFKQETEDEGLKQRIKEYPEVFNYAKNLNNMECIGIGKFLLIDPVTGRKYHNGNRPILMKILPPTSRHKPPQHNGKK